MVVSLSPWCREEYDAAKAASVAAEEATIALFQNRKEIVAERKEARLQSEEAQRFNRKLEERVRGCVVWRRGWRARTRDAVAVWMAGRPCGPVLSAQYSRVGVHVCVGVQAKLKQQYYLWQLYHIENDIAVHKKRHAELAREVQRLQQQTTAAAKRLDAKVKQHRKVNTQLGVAQAKASKASKLQKKCAAKVEELLAGIDSARTTIETTQSQEEQVRRRARTVGAATRWP